MADGVEQADRLGGRERQPAEVAAGGHRADEHAAVGGVVLHAHPVAEDRPARERRRRVDREHGDLVARRAHVADDRAGERALARARRAGEADRVGVAGMRRGEPADLAGVGAAALDQRQQPGQRGAVAGAGGLEQRRRVVRSSGARSRRHRPAQRYATLTTSVTPSMRSRMMRSIPAFSVWDDAGQPTQAPISSTVIDAGGLVDVVQDDVAAVGLQRRADDLDRLFDLRAHAGGAGAACGQGCSSSPY